MASKLKAVLWKTGAGTITDANGDEVEGGQVAEFKAKRADRLIANALATPVEQEESDDGDDDIRGDGGGRDGKAPAERVDHGDDQAGEHVED